MKIPIIFSTDHNFIMPTGVAITSLLFNSRGEEYEINILITENVTEDDKSNIAEIVNGSNSTIKFKYINNLFENAYEVRGISKATYFRLLIPWLFPNYDKIIYCDGDIIFRKNLSSLFNEDISDFYVGGVKDSFGSKSFKRHISSIGLDWDKYINAGILLINCKKQREDKLNLLYEKHFNKKYEYQDQDIINLVCKNHIKYLPLIYNLNPASIISFYKNTPEFSKRYPDVNNESFKDITIIHYCGRKPWRLQTGILMGDWWYFYSKAPWYNAELEYRFNHSLVYPKPTIKNILKIIKHNFLE